ncbi:hypothetical protein ACE1OE_20615 [Vibrio sp. E150_011]
MSEKTYAAGSGDAPVAIVNGTTIPAVAGPDFVVLTIALMQIIIFMSSLFAIYRIWIAVINFVGDQPSKKSDVLIKILGNIDTSADVNVLKTRAVGTGVASTVAILTLAVAAMYVIGNHTVT